VPAAPAGLTSLASDAALCYRASCDCLQCGHQRVRKEQAAPAGLTLQQRQFVVQEPQPQLQQYVVPETQPQQQQYVVQEPYPRQRQYVMQEPQPQLQQYHALVPVVTTYDAAISAGAKGQQRQQASHLLVKFAARGASCSASSSPFMRR